MFLVVQLYGSGVPNFASCREERTKSKHRRHVDRTRKGGDGPDRVPLSLAELSVTESNEFDLMAFVTRVVEVGECCGGQVSS